MQQLTLIVRTEQTVSVGQAARFLASVSAVRESVALGVLPGFPKFEDPLYGLREGSIGVYLDKHLIDWSQVLSQVAGNIAQGKIERLEEPRIASLAHIWTTAIHAETSLSEHPLRLISLRAGSLETVIEEVWDEIAEKLRRIFSATAVLVSGGSREEYFATWRDISKPSFDRSWGKSKVASGMLGLAVISLENSLRSVGASDVRIE